MSERDILERLEALVAARRSADPSTSYVASLNAKGSTRSSRRSARKRPKR
jgi:phosphoribosyl-ATP pyrophosphohydrolase